MIFINFSFIVYEKLLNIPNDLGIDFEGNINRLISGKVLFETLNIRSGEKRRIINYIFQN